ncbi:MAG: hypothetical protein ACREXQ_06140, partial [Polaromonas sp.]
MTPLLTINSSALRSTPIGLWPGTALLPVVARKRVLMSTMSAPVRSHRARPSAPELLGGLRRCRGRRHQFRDAELSR